MVLIWSSFYTKVLSLPIFCYHLLVVDRHKLTVFYLKSFDKDSVQVGKAVFCYHCFRKLSETGVYCQSVMVCSGIHIRISGYWVQIDILQ